MKAETISGQMVLSVAVAAMAFAFYVKTLAPSVIWGDSAKLALFVETVDLSCRLEYHSLHTLIGLVFNQLPFGDIAYRLNLMSAFFGAATVGIMYAVLLRLTASRLAAMGAALSLAVSHVFWLVSVITESYTLFAFLMAAMLWLSIRWEQTGNFRYLSCASAVFGLSLANNLLMPFILPAFVYFCWTSGHRSSLSPGRWVQMGLCATAGAAVLIFLVLESAANGGYELRDLLSAGPFQRYYRTPGKIAFEMLHLPAYVMYQFPLFGISFGLIGAGSLFKRRRRLFNFVLLIGLCDAVFACGYMRQKQFYLLIPAFIAFAIFIGFGVAVVAGRLERLGGKRAAQISAAICLCLTVTPIATYYAAPLLLEKVNVDLVKARGLPYRDNNRFFLFPAKQNEFGAERFGREVFEMVGPNSIVVADFTPIAVLRYFQTIKQVRCDVRLKLVDFEPLKIEYIDRHIATHPIYLANDLEPDYNIAGLRARYNVIPFGPIFRIEPKAAGAAPMDREAVIHEAAVDGHHALVARP